MTRDTSHQQEIQKFSFIESLNLSQLTNSNAKPNGKNFPGDRRINFQQSPSSIVSTSDTAAAIDSSRYSPPDTERLSLDDLIDSASATAEPNKPPKRNYLGKLLFALSCSYSLFVLWWFFGHQLSRIPLVLTGGKQVVLSQSEVQFIDYMERSLDKLDRQLDAKKDSTEDEVVFVPVYTPTLKPQLPEVVSPSKPIALPEPPSFEALKIPAPPPLPEPSLIGNSVVQQEATKPSKPAITHTLIGILELSESKSAALVKVAGKTKRVELGEKISDGWILESVSDRQATVNNGGQVRSVSVGETF